MIDVLVSVPVVFAGLYLVGLAVAAFASPARVRSFLSKFASSASAHFLELFARLAIGAALLANAPQMKFPRFFSLFGWVLVVTTIVLLLVPWRWHHRFAKWSVPRATQNMTLLGLGSLAGGVFLLLSVAFGPGLTD